MSMFAESKRTSKPTSELPDVPAEPTEHDAPPLPSHVTEPKDSSAPVELAVRTVETYFEGTGTVCSRATFLGDQKHGLESWFGRSGRLLSTAMHKHGLRNGLNEIFDDNGAVMQRAEYLNGETVMMQSPGHEPFASHESKLHRPRALLDDRGRDYVLPLGEITVFKALDAESVFVRAELLVPAEARRVTPMQEPGLFKSRVSRAHVVRIFDRAGREYESAVSFVHGQRLVYTAKRDIFPDRYSGMVGNSCDAGISVVRYLDHCDQWESCMPARA